MRILSVIVGSLVALGLVLWGGLRVPPRPFPDLDAAGAAPSWEPLPDGLPAPVERFYRELYGDQLPVIDTAAITGRGTMRVSGVTLPVRWRFVHQAGEGYRHDIEVTLFRARVLTIEELFRDGTARLELPFGVSEGPNIDQGANLALWSETIWMPSVWVTDPRARWEAVDEHTALLIVPFGDGEETFVARFDPNTGLLRLFESMRFKGEHDATRTLWLNEAISWEEIDGWRLPIVTEVTWFDDGSPWAVLTTEDVRYNVPLTDELQPAP